MFTKKNAAGESLFNVLLLAQEPKHYVSEEGLRVWPDALTADAPSLQVLIVPGSQNPTQQIRDAGLIDFIRRHRHADYLASHCAGAFLLGEAGVATGKKVVTYRTGGALLQQAYPDLLVQDDLQVAVVHDGHLITSNGNLVSYRASLELLEKLSSPQHRRRVEAELLLPTLTNAYA